MSREQIIGFEDGGTGLISSPNGLTTGSVISTSGTDFDGNYCLDISGTTDYVQYLFKGNQSEYHLSFLATLTPSLGDRQGLCIVQTMGLDTLSVVVDWMTESYGTVKAYFNNTLVSTSGTTVPASEVLRFYFYMKSADSGGRIVAKVSSWYDNNATLDNVTLVDYTGDTRLAGLSSFYAVYIGKFTVVGPSIVYSGMYIDNLIIDTNTEINDSHICALVPSGAGTHTNWTPSAGNNYACVDEIPESILDYNSNGNTAIMDTFLVSAMPESGVTIKCIQVQTTAEKEGTPTAKYLQQRIQLGALYGYAGDYYEPTEDPISFSYCWTQNPKTSTNWAEEDLSELEIGYLSFT